MPLSLTHFRKLCIFKRMKSLLITPKDTAEMQFITALLQRPGIGVAEVPSEELEDAGLLNLLQK